MPRPNILWRHAQLAIARTMEVRREEYLDYMTFRANERPLFTEIFGPLRRAEGGVGGAGRDAGGAGHVRLPLSPPRWTAASRCTPAGWAATEEEILEETEDYIDRPRPHGPAR